MKTYCLIVTVLLLLSGCASFGEGLGKGFAEAVLQNDEDDKGICDIIGGEFSGLESSLDATQNNPEVTTKLLMIHGIGEHVPGYSARLQENLANSLGMEVSETRFKELPIFQPAELNSKIPVGDSVANLRIYRMQTRDLSRELLFYELTWSKVAEPEREIVAFDQSEQSNFRRAGVNTILKDFLNSKIPDPLIYLGDKRETILIAASQAICWMANSDWDGLPNNTDRACNAGNHIFIQNLAEDNFYFVTHSLGSRILIDTLQRMAMLTSDDEQHRGFYQQVSDTFQEKRFTVFMLANQLPLLQIGRKEPEVIGQIPEVCGDGGSMRDERFLEQTSIIAFSDPNDILSYSVSPEFVDTYLDSRLCPVITNVNINVAAVKGLLGLSEVADPIAAHLDYDNDERIIAMITDGLKQNQQPVRVKEDCRFMRTTNHFGNAGLN